VEDLAPRRKIRVVNLKKVISILSCFVQRNLAKTKEAAYPDFKYFYLLQCDAL
jgi:hypothetical protein